MRRQGHEAAEAQDLTQEFFARLIHRDYLARVDHGRGKFRSFLLAFLQHFLAEQRGRAMAQKRGGGSEVVSLDVFDAQEGYLNEPVDELNPEQIFERRWAQTVLQRALDRLSDEYVHSDRASLFEALKDFEPRQSGSLTYAEIAASLGTTEGAVKSAMQRLRQRHREILRDEIAQTVSSAAEVDEEIRQSQSIRKEFTPKPNSYFVYGLISRLTAKHSAVLACERTGGQIDGTNRVFAAALRSPKGGLTWVIVNDAPRAWRAHFGVQHAPERALYKYQVTAAERDQPTLRIDPIAKVHLNKGEFDTILPPLSLTIFSTFHLAHTRPGIITD